MTILKDIIAKVRDSITDNKTWQAEKDGVLAQLQDAETKLKDYQESAVTAAQMKESFEKQIAELTNAHTQTVNGLNEQITNLRAGIEAEKNSVEKKAQAIAASIGIADESQLPKVNSVVLTKENVHELMAKDKTFFEKNKTEILKLAGIPESLWNSK